MECGKRAADLLRSIHSCPKDTVPPYNEEDVRLVLNEVEEYNNHRNQLFARVVRMEEERKEREEKEGQEPADFSWDMYKPEHAAAMVDNEVIKRNKRILLAYLNERLIRLKSIRWQRSELPAEVRENLSPAEVEFYNKYDELLTSYTGWGNGGISMDLTLDVAPPRDVGVYVMAVQDKGQVMFSSGAVDLKPGSVHYLSVTEAEPLLREGALVLVDP